jgi:peptidoglycan/xylan/chitin deacetylase (PgdA/CDA1 family)
MTNSLRAVMLAAVVAALAATIPVAAQQAPSNPFPGARLSLEQLKEQLSRVSAGRRLKPRAWPNGARVAVALTFDVDNVSGALARGDLGSGVLSRGEYGAIDGLPRILRLLDRHAVPATFFIPAVSAAMHPQMITDILSKKRHEIGVHGWIHENLPMINDEAEEKRLLTQSIDYLTKVTGKRPVGYRAPAWEFSRFTLRQIREAGFLYDSSMMASDDAYEILMEGKPSGVIELPIEWILDDNPYFGGTAGGSLPSGELVSRVLQSEFDVAHEESGLYVLTMHPHVIGHRSRVVMLDALIQHMKSKQGVWFATLEQIANHVKSAAPASN